jgi:cytidine deaminase
MNDMKEYEELSTSYPALDAFHPNQPKNLRFMPRSDYGGNSYSASVFWSATSSLTVHAEHAALAHAAAHGERGIVAIACVSTEDEQGEKICHPCGLCKQVIYESSMDSGIDVEVIMASLSGHFVVKNISEIVSYPWPT